MMRNFPFLSLIERHGGWLSAGIALGFLGLCLCLPPAFSWPGAALACLVAVTIWLLLRVLTDIVRLLSETLIPRP